MMNFEQQVSMENNFMEVQGDKELQDFFIHGVIGACSRNMDGAGLCR
jgi:hypothetical protein